MTTYDQIQPLDFRLAEGHGLTRRLHAFSLPPRWLEMFGALVASPTGEPRTPPIRSLVDTLRLLAPDLLYVDPWRQPRVGTTWLHAWEPIGLEVLLLVARAWVMEGFNGNGRAPAARDLETVADQLSVGDLTWSPEDVDFSQYEVLPNGTADPSPTYFRALPDLVCAVVSEARVRLSVGFEWVLFRRAYGPSGPELVSWPPLPCQTKSGTWYWSYVIAPTVQTTPVQPFPLLRCTVHVRRWVSKSLVRPSGFNQLPANSNTSAYVFTEDPWLTGLSAPRSLASAWLRLARTAKDDGGRTWTPSWQTPVERILSRLQVSPGLPSAEELVRNPDIFVNGRNNGAAAIVFYNALGSRHAAGSGVPPLDRWALFEGLAGALAQTGLIPSERLPRARIKSGRASALTKRFIDVPADTRRESLKAVTMGRLTFEILAQSAQMEPLLREEIKNALDLIPQEGGTPGTEVYVAPGLTVEVKVRALGALGSVLSGEEGHPIRSPQERRPATRRRAREVQDELGGAEGRILTLVELSNGAGSPADPKDALRWGLAKTGRLSQFVTPVSVEDLGDTEEAKGNARQRARSGVRDLLRQAGYLPGTVLDQLPPGSAIPRDLQLLALWAVQLDRHRTDKQLLPVLVRIDPSHGVRATFPGAHGWLAYPDALIEVARRQEELGVSSPGFAAFVERTAKDCAQLGPVLLVCHAQSSRRYWPWLTNKGLIQDKIAWSGDDEAMPPEGMRVARIRDGEEAPQWIAGGKGHPGIPSGLFDGHSDRTFFSLQKKPLSMKTGRNHSKLDRPRQSVAMPALEEVYLAVLREGDDATEWALLVHRLREMAPHYDEALKYPLPLHLAKGLAEYVAVRQEGM